jgi:hypothetical protein
MLVGMTPDRLTPEQRQQFERIMSEVGQDNPAVTSQTDQFKAQSSELARQLLALYVSGSLLGEKGEAEAHQQATVLAAMTIGNYTKSQAVGVIVFLADLVCQFLVAQGDGTWATAVARIGNPDIPLIPGRPTPSQDPLRRLDQELGPAQ